MISVGYTIWHIWRAFVGTLFQKKCYKKVIMVIYKRQGKHDKNEGEMADA